ncbi:hypothetical protein [Aquimarina sp. RZ0]|uniref:hypothetical protein n=1 Tax=Aquimarina sp. RZ0 TaxID=2607730 RepID=UPI0011F3B72B|nr:hypothetical protein [Aquimarina sp. RZ0]KAA1247720.1 hypothetical protein F0000_02625 [Aquimarina sp. RZ0]
MKNSIKIITIVTIMVSVFFVMSCDSDDNSASIIGVSGVKIEEARLLDFPLLGIQRTAIDIIQPEIVDNKAVTYGEIKITVPGTIISLSNIHASITSEELNLSKFSISPGNDIELSFEDEKIQIFTIHNAIGDKEELLHYKVSIIKEAVVDPETLKITSFKFEKSKNPGLAEDITISRTIEEPGGDILYVFVPLGTDFTNLVPTVTYDGAKLYYTQDSSVSPENINEEFLDVDMSIDFKYPKSFILMVRDKNNDQFRTTKVIVDVINPVRIETISVTTPDVIGGYLSEVFGGVTRWVNQGNQKLGYQKPPTYKDMSPIITPTFNVITARRNFPSQGLKPGESADINVIVNSSFPEGTYTTTAVFYTRIYRDSNVDDLLEPVNLTISSRIIR